MRRVSWDPLTESPPVWDGTWDACVVPVLDWPTLYAAYQHLATGHHPFRSVVVDSLTEAQKRLVDDVAGVDQPSLPQWGVIARNLEDMVRKLRDLTIHKTHPIEAVLIVCLTHLRDGSTRPFLKGQIELSLPAFVDVVGYLYTEQIDGQIQHRMLIAPVNNIIAKCRPDVLGDHGPVITDAKFTDWLDILEAGFGQQQTAIKSTSKEASTK